MGSALVRRRNLCLALVVVLVALAPRLLTASDDFVTADEPRWMARSDGFYDALASADFGDASAYQEDGHTVTMPGITTMWVGMGARGVYNAGHATGFFADAETDFGRSALGLDIAQIIMVTLGSVFLGLLVFLVSEWAGTFAAAVTGLLLATEPFLVALGAVLHTDQLLTFCGVASLVSMALALGLPHRTRWADNWWAYLIAGMLFAAAWLTKVSAVMYLPGIALLVAWAILRLVRDEEHRSRSRGVWSALRPAAIWWTVGAVGLVILTYPALWADPINEVYWLTRSASQGVREHTQVFLGTTTPTPGPLFYLVALPLRITPWFFAAGLAACIAVWRRGTRGFAIAALLMAGPPFMILSIASKQFDRYGLPLLAVGAVVIGIVASVIADALARRRFALWRAAVIGAALLAIAAVANTMTIGRWGMDYFNPALGGSSVAEDALTVGWGEGLERAVTLVERHADKDCADVTVFADPWNDGILEWMGCEPTFRDQNSTYVILYIYQRQRMTDAAIKSLTDHRELVGTVEARGFTLAEVFGPAASDADKELPS